MVGISFVSGMLSQKISLNTLFNLSIFLCLIALLLVALNYTVIGILMAFLFNTIVVTYSSLIAISENKENPLQAISGTSTWWDLGAGIGAFSGILLIELIGQQYLFLILTTLITILFINFNIRYAKAN